MNISEKDKQEVKRVSELILKINKIDQHYLELNAEIVSNQQPFLFSLIKGYAQDLSPKEAEEMMKNIFIIWEYFKDSEKIMHKRITEVQFERIHGRNIQFLSYFEGEQGGKDKSNLVSSDLEHLKSKALLTGLMFRFNTQPIFKEIKGGTKGGLLIGMKSLIECFEEIANS